MVNPLLTACEDDREREERVSERGESLKRRDATHLKLLQVAEAVQERNEGCEVGVKGRVGCPRDEVLSESEPKGWEEE